jgi:hypothetical protein
MTELLIFYVVVFLCFLGIGLWCEKGLIGSLVEDRATLILLCVFWPAFIWAIPFIFLANGGTIR